MNIHSPCGYYLGSLCHELTTLTRDFFDQLDSYHFQAKANVAEQWAIFIVTTTRVLQRS